MGVSTDALIYWGFDFCEGYNEDYPFFTEEYDYDWEKYWLEQKGYEEPDVDWDTYISEDRENWPDREKWDKWYKIKREALENCHCEISAHCSNEYPIHFVSIEYSGTSASRGYPEDLTGFMQELDYIDYDEWREQLKEFCETMGIEWQEPKWYLASYWG